ncbi:MAG TPA: patatin-like phospholipase family protein [Xanthobacteraceae bacterium]|nr:patatin-like phospholipase family protein [Xanthobacteraceae bacterium]
MSDTSSKPVEIGVVLQGGGALGAYECGAMNALLELMDEFTGEGREIVLKVVTGVSIGSINAACVVGAKNGADARARLDALWDDLTLQAPPFWMAAAQRDLAYFGLPGFYTPRPDFWTAPTWTYLYDTRPLLATLARHVDFAALNASETTLVVTAVEVVTGELRPFASKAIGKVPATKIEPRHVLASGSLPPAFPWTEIDGIPYWDGGIVDNTPLGLAIDAFSTDPDVERMLVVMNLYPLRARLPRNLAGVEDRMHELSYGNRMRQDHHTARRINALVETVEDLAALVAPDELDDRLRARLDEARRYKVVDAIVNVDFQDPAVTLVPGAQAAADDKDGMRDFSPDTVHRRRRDGFRFAEDVLRPAFENLWRTPEERGRAVIGSRKIAAGRPKPARRAQRSALDDKEPS